MTLQQLRYFLAAAESGRRVKIYTLTRAGRNQLHKEEEQWQRAASIVERFLNITEDAS